MRRNRYMSHYSQYHYIITMAQLVNKKKTTQKMTSNNHDATNLSPPSQNEPRRVDAENQDPLKGIEPVPLSHSIRM